MSRPKLAPEEEQKRMRLYRQGMPDDKIAEVVGVTRRAICLWRHSRGLPLNRKRTKRTNRKKVNKRSSLVKRIRADRRIKSVPMETVLSPEQCSVMRQFMTHLVFAKKLNPELNVGQFMKEYRKVM
ncbi:MAG: hypothetical protein PWQ82_1172 [Thermosediminibacterales bacterium]|nr:hypothetical protein [Thermosediminibacterales bacterium]